MPTSVRYIFNYASRVARHFARIECHSTTNRVLLDNGCTRKRNTAGNDGFTFGNRTMTRRGHRSHRRAGEPTDIRLVAESKQEPRVNDEGE